jgi:hypothetical protein
MSKSPSSTRWLARANAQPASDARNETREILQTRRATSGTMRSRWLDVQRGFDANGTPVSMISPRASDGGKLGRHHWRNLHKNLAKPILRTKRVKQLETTPGSNQHMIKLADGTRYTRRPSPAEHNGPSRPTDPRDDS